MFRRLTALALVGFSAIQGHLATAADAVDFETAVLPIFTAHCVKCHGTEKANGKLRLDAAAEITATAKESLLGGGDADSSELLARVMLPEGDRKRMPKGAPPLSPDDVATIRQWLESGASLTITENRTTAGASDAVSEGEAEISPPRTPGEEDHELASLSPASGDAIAAIQAAGGSVMPLFGDSPLLQVSFAQAASPAGDAALQSLVGAAENIVWLNLSKAQISAEGVEHVAKLKNLIRLHLEQSTIDDAGVAKLVALPRLEYLNLYGTSVTDIGVKPLADLMKLRSLYVWQTEVSWDAAQALQEAIPGLAVNLGWDHPQVAKLRVAKELEAAKKIAETAAARAAELEQQFAAANEAKEQTAARVAELEGELEALGNPAQAPSPAGESSEEPATGDDST